MEKSKIEFEILRDILKISNSTLNLHERLNQVVEEIVRTMVGGIGLMLAGPMPSLAKAVTRRPWLR